jgi:hypothetical protein
LTPEDAQDPRIRALAEWTLARAVQSVDGMQSEVLALIQDNIEKSAAARIKGGIDLGPLRPLVGHLQTGQLNAVSMRVPGRSGAYLVLFEAQMQLFASTLSEAVASALPHPTNANGELAFDISVRGVTERIEANPEVADRLAEIVAIYALTGRIEHTEPFPVRPDYFKLASLLSTSLQYFVLSHEYAHILMGHLDTTTARKGVLPVTETKALVYSWEQELAADLLGMVLSINARTDCDTVGLTGSFWGIGLYFDALDVMDRAVALLETDDRERPPARLAPPSNLRKQRLCDSLSELGGGNTANAKTVRTALELVEAQGVIIRLLWERTRPVLLGLRRSGVRAAPKWRTIPKETGDEAG